MVKAVFENLGAAKTKNHFTVGIQDDVGHTSLTVDPSFSILDGGIVQAIFYGLGSDGTVGANKNSIKIIGENTDNFAQGYFVYDSRKAGAVTISHLRFGPEPIQAPYLIYHANFIACHQPVFLDRYDMLKEAAFGGTFLLNAPFGPEEVWKELPCRIQEDMIERNLKFYVIDAYKVAHDSEMGGKINTIMQVCFFAISGVLPRDRALAEIKESIRKTYAKKGESIVAHNLKAVDKTLENLFEVSVPLSAGEIKVRPPVSEKSPQFVREVLSAVIEGRGDALPVSCFPADGTYPTGKSQWEKRDLAREIPVWEPKVCIECGKCSMICPHSAVRIKVYESAVLKEAPAAFKSREARDPDWKGQHYTIQVAPEDCTGCGLCVEICPAVAPGALKSAGVKEEAGRVPQAPMKALHMEPQPPLREQEKKNWEFFLNVPVYPRERIKVTSVRHEQLQEPLFEFSSACLGCGETPYIKLVTQLFGDRAMVANATGCSSIFGGNLPTTPWTKNKEGRGPAWANSLFEDNAEFGFGFRVSIDKQKENAEELLRKLSSEVGCGLSEAILSASQQSEAEIYEQRKRVQMLKEKLSTLKGGNNEVTRLLGLADMLVKKSVWIIGGDGWAYDIGFGGLDHVLASGRDVNVLVLDTEVYSNTGGQMSKATPRGAIAKFAAAGKPTAKKDLGLMVMTYGNVYVARVAMGARDEQTLKAFLEAESYEGPSLIIAYSHCIAHGIDMTNALQGQKAIVDSGQWNLFRYDPRRLEKNENPMILDSRSPRYGVDSYLMMENRFKQLAQTRPEDAKRLFKQAQKDADVRWRLYEFLAKGLSHDLFSKESG